MQAALLLKKKSQASQRPIKHTPSNDLKLSISFKPQSEDDAVHFKRDGARFKSDQTLKLTQDTTYQLTATLTPSTSVVGMHVFGAPCEYNVNRSASSSAFTCTCSTLGMEPSKKNQRSYLPIILQLEELGDIRVDLQCKIYPSDSSNHSKWGSKLHHIDVQFNKPAGQFTYQIKDIAYR